MNQFFKGIFTTLGFIIFSEVVYNLYLFCWRNVPPPKSENKDTGKIIEVFFFPDKEIACTENFLGESRCLKVNCKYSHGKTSLSELYRHLSSCRRTMDVCVYVMTCSQLIDIVCNMHRRGVVVRVITDDDQVNIPGSQIWRLRNEGICVRTDRSSFFMHHKFVLIDNKLLINGSFNWTRNAITGNQENVVVTDYPQLVQAFQAEFEKLWIQFAPEGPSLQI